MIPVPKIRKPAGFAKDVEKPGKAWLAQNLLHSDKKLPDYWRTRGSGKYVRALRDGFSQRCGYTAHLIDHGTVDHFLSKEKHPDKAYQWSNYRYAASWMNSAKKPAHDKKLLDPFEVQAGWFEIILPSMQLVLNDKRIPRKFLAKALFTLQTLPIRDDERVVDYRAGCYEQYKSSPNKATALQWLHREAPLVAEAVQRWEQQHPGSALP